MREDEVFGLFVCTMCVQIHGERILSSGAMHLRKERTNRAAIIHLFKMKKKTKPENRQTPNVK